MSLRGSLLKATLVQLLSDYKKGMLNMGANCFYCSDFVLFYILSVFSLGTFFFFVPNFELQIASHVIKFVVLILLSENGSHK